MTYRRILKILYLNIHSKDLFHHRPLLEANELLYDSTGKGKPIYIPVNILRKSVNINELPLIFGHENKNVKIGFINNLNYEDKNKVLVGDIHVYSRWNRWLLRKFAEGVNGLSAEFNSREIDEKGFFRVLSLDLERVAVVPSPAVHKARLY